MQEVIIKESKLTFVDPVIVERYSTEIIILDDLTEFSIDKSFSVEDIHKVFKERGKNGIGYHFIIKKDGTVKEGLPIFARGSLTNQDWRSINILICGKFNEEQLTDAQIEMTAMLLANLTDKYSLPTDKNHIFGKQAFVNSISPGKNLNDSLETLIGKANWYRYKGDIEINNKKPIDDPMISEHFSKSEFWCHGQEQGTCNCDHSLEINPRLLALLEQLRSNIGGLPLYINSGYRCPVHNAAVGGATYSQHKLGNAADVARPSHLSFEEFKWYVEQVPFDAMGLYYAGDFIHCDVRYNGIGAHEVFYGA